MKAFQKLLFFIILFLVCNPLPGMAQEAPVNPPAMIKNPDRTGHLSEGNSQAFPQALEQENKTYPNAQKILEQSDKVLRGNSHRMKIAMYIKTANWERDYDFEIWMKGVDSAFSRVLGPAKVQGQGFLRQKARLWQFLPKAERTVLIPPSMMLDRFMGSDFSNDDFVKLSYLPRDYKGRILGEEEMDGFSVYHLELMPHPDAPVTYGKLEMWLRKSDSAPVQTLFYDEHLNPIRKLHYSEFKTFGDHEIPTLWDMENLKNKERHTKIQIQDAIFDLEVSDSLFTRENLEKVS